SATGGEKNTGNSRNHIDINTRHPPLCNVIKSLKSNPVPRRIQKTSTRMVAAHQIKLPIVAVSILRVGKREDSEACGVKPKLPHCDVSETAICRGSVPHRHHRVS